MILYSNGSQVINLGYVSAAMTSVTIERLTPGSTSQFAVVAFTNSSQAESSWVTVTTLHSTSTRPNASTLADYVFELRLEQQEEMM